MLTSILVILTAGVFIYAAIVYDRLIRYRNQAEQIWVLVEAALKRRRDLIPNLSESVRSAMELEGGTLAKAMEARLRAGGASTMKDRLHAEEEISGLLGRVYAV